MSSFLKQQKVGKDNPIFCVIDDGIVSHGGILSPFKANSLRIIGDDIIVNDTILRSHRNVNPIVFTIRDGIVGYSDLSSFPKPNSRLPTISDGIVGNGIFPRIVKGNSRSTIIEDSIVGNCVIPTAAQANSRASVLGDGIVSYGVLGREPKSNSSAGVIGDGIVDYRVIFTRGPTINGNSPPVLGDSIVGKGDTLRVKKANSHPALGNGIVSYGTTPRDMNVDSRLTVVGESIVVDGHVRATCGEHAGWDSGQGLPRHFDPCAIEQKDLPRTGGDAPPPHILPKDQGTAIDHILRYGRLYIVFYRPNTNAMSMTPI